MNLRLGCCRVVVSGRFGLVALGHSDAQRDDRIETDDPAGRILYRATEAASFLIFNTAGRIVHHTRRLACRIAGWGLAGVAGAAAHGLIPTVYDPTAMNTSREGAGGRLRIGRVDISSETGLATLLPGANGSGKAGDVNGLVAGPAHFAP